MNQEELLIKKDRMRFIKNKLPANLALLGILFAIPPVAASERGGAQTGGVATRVPGL